MVKIGTGTYNILRKEPNPEMTEKDYLECLILDKLFSDAYICDNFVFAGGASLSKSYRMTNRIGQDIDLVCSDFDDIPDNHSRKQLDKFRKRFKATVFSDLKQKIGEVINKNQQFLIMTDGDWRGLKNTEQFMTSPTLHLMYKSEFSTNLGHLCIEIIPRKYPVSSITYSDVIPYSIGQSIGDIPTVRYEQTFWDKVYALHSNSVAARPHFNQFFSRHYYDVATIASRIDLPATWDMLLDIERHQAKYTLKHIAPLESFNDVHLLPDADTLHKLGVDYAAADDRFLTARDDWNQIVHKLEKLNRKLKTL